MKQSAFDYLIKNEILNIDMIELLSMPGAEILRTERDGVLLYREGLFELAADPDKAASFLPYLVANLQSGVEQMIVLHNDELLENLVSEHGFSRLFDCYQAIYRSSEPVPYSLPEDAIIRPLDLSYLDFVHAHYHTVDDVSYVRERIEEGMFGVFIRGQIAGFAGTHEERSMGLLEVLPEYRRMGLAYALEAHLINHLLTLGRIPFCQISIHNEPSIALQKKIGLEFSEPVIHWLVRK